MWPFNRDVDNEVVRRAKRINKVLDALNISRHSTEGKEMRDICALELLGEEHKTLELYSKTKYTASAGKEKIEQALFLLQGQGLIKNGKLQIDQLADDKEK